jgi:hypothetical protein
MKHDEQKLQDGEVSDAFDFEVSPTASCSLVLSHHPINQPMPIQGALSEVSLMFRNHNLNAQDILNT